MAGSQDRPYVTAFPIPFFFFFYLFCFTGDTFDFVFLLHTSYLMRVHRRCIFLALRLLDVPFQQVVRLTRDLTFVATLDLGNDSTE